MGRGGRGGGGLGEVTPKKSLSLLIIYKRQVLTPLFKNGVTNPKLQLQPAVAKLDTKDREQIFFKEKEKRLFEHLRLNFHD